MKAHEEWFFKAFNDLQSSEILLKSGKKIFDICVFHTHQCVEKTLKGYLVFQGKEIERTHNIIYLLALCTEDDTSFETIKDEVVFIHPFGTQFRYPDGDLLPTEDETKKAVEYASAIYNFVLDLIKKNT